MHHSEGSFGTHSCFYYYSPEHLYVNLYSITCKCIEKNQKILISVEKDLYDGFVKVLEKGRIDTGNISFISSKELILSHKLFGADGLKKRLKEYAESAKKEGHSGVLWIGQPSLAIRQATKQDFLGMEKDLNLLSQEEKLDILCVYDFYDYMHSQEIIDDEVVTDSETTHTHRLYQMHFIPAYEVSKSSPVPIIV